MMTEKEYDTLVETKELADKFSDFWYGLIISISETMDDVMNYGVVGLTDDNVFHDAPDVILDREPDTKNSLCDFSLVQKIYEELHKLKLECSKRCDYWDTVLEETTNDLESWEAKVYERNADEPDMNLWPLNSFDFGMIEEARIPA